MASQLRWQQQWASTLTWREGWSDAFSIGSGTLAMVGHSTLEQTGFQQLGVKSLGSLTLAMVGHVGQNGGFPLAMPTATVPQISPTPLHQIGHLTIAGNLDYNEPFMVDPPMELTRLNGHLGISGDLIYGNVKSLGPLRLNVVGHVGYQPVTLQIATSIVKPLYTTRMDLRGQLGLAGALTMHTDRQLGAPTLRPVGHMSITGDLAIASPGPVVIDLGALTLPLIGGITVATPELAYSTVPPTNIGSVSLAMSGKIAVSPTSFWTGGGEFSLGNATLALNAYTHLSSMTSYPGTPGSDKAEKQMKLFYEGLDQQAIHADPEDDGMTV